MKKFKTYFFYALLLSAIACACNDDLNVRQAYSFDLETMPVPKKVAEGDTVEIRCTLVKEGEYSETEFFIRYFQTDGKGELRLGDSLLFKPNDLYPLKEEKFRLYYTSFCKVQQTIDVYIEDSFGQVIRKTFGWQNDGTDDDVENKDKKSSVF